MKAKGRNRLENWLKETSTAQRDDVAENVLDATDSDKPVEPDVEKRIEAVRFRY